MAHRSKTCYNDRAYFLFRIAAKGNPVQLAWIFDVDGVILDSPHERAWREALSGFANPTRFTTAFYQRYVAGKARLDGARAALEGLGLSDAASLAATFADRKQRRLEALIAGGGIRAFPDALRFLDELVRFSGPLAVASSSKNANAMMRDLRLPSGMRLLEAFTANVCGRDVAHGKPDPELFLDAAAELRIDPAACCVVEDAPAGILAALAAKMRSLGVARLGDSASLRAAGANLIVNTLDRVSIGALSDGRLERT